MQISTVEKASITLEKLQPTLAEIGLTLREIRGHTCYAVIGADSTYARGFAFYIGKANSDTADNSAWTEIRFGN